jgi:hypothetical protein
MSDMPASRPSDTASHAAHDLALIAALHDRDSAEALRPAELEMARAQLDACPACAALHRDLGQLVGGLRSSMAPSRPRDFRLTAADAKRLQPGGLRGFLRTIGSARDGLSRPLAIGLTTLGLVGVLVGTIPGGMSLGVATSGEDSAGGQQAAPAPSGAAAAPAAGEAIPDRTHTLEMASEDPVDTMQADGYVFNGSEGFATDGDQQRQTVQSTAEDASLRDDPSGVSAMVVIGGTMLIIGLGLFALRWSARRLG